MFVLYFLQRFLDIGFMFNNTEKFEESYSIENFLIQELELDSSSLLARDFKNLYSSLCFYEIQPTESMKKEAMKMIKKILKSGFVPIIDKFLEQGSLSLIEASRFKEFLETPTSSRIWYLYESLKNL